MIADKEETEILRVRKELAQKHHVWKRVAVFDAALRGWINKRAVNDYTMPCAMVATPAKVIIDLEHACLMKQAANSGKTCLGIPAQRG